MSNDPTGRTMEINGAEIYVEEHGHGTPLVLVHGGLGAGVEWSPLIRQLADNFRVITPDSRGHGRSTNPAKALSYPAIADDLAGLIAALELDRPVVAGWSDGGQAALELAVRHPGIAGAIVVGGAYPDFDAGLHEVHRALLGADAAGVPDLDHLAAELGDDAEGIQSLHQGGEHHWATLIEQTASMWLDYPGLSPTQVAAIAEPALVLAGDRDQFIPLDLSVALYRALTHAELAVIPSADHSAPFTPERATVFAALIGDFAERHIRDSTGERTGTGIVPLRDARAETRLPAQDLHRAHRWYAEKLGLEPAEERPGGLRYQCASGVFCLFDSSGTSDGTFTQLALNVADIDAEVAELRRRGVQFEDIDMPGFATVDGIVDVDGNYPSKGRAERGAFFRDSENNMIALGQPLP